MTPFLYAYVAAWASACLLALILWVQRRPAHALTQAGYWRFLLQPWKVVTFLVATLAIITAAPYSGDPTWDYADAAFMAILTYLTAPWAVGVLYRALRGRENAARVYVAACAWLFSASWSYDIYLLWRDGYYPGTWLANMFASSILYLCAGLLWNLTWVEGRGVIFAFMQADWPRSDSAGFGKIVWFALPFMLIAFAMLGAFVADSQGWL